MQKRDLKRCKSLSFFKCRQFFCLLAAFLLCAELSARSGMLWGEKKLRVAKTQWFDIIYPERCQESASILYEKADTVYEEVTAQYGLTPSFRIPVVITPAVEQFNAFWTAVPYNHIAIYDTACSGCSELAVFSETLLSTFRHELTHAVTYNMKNGFWRGVGKIFGDCVTPGMFAVTTGMAEGATLTSESAAGEGRLNDEYAKHYVKQAKIEDKFPSYHDVSGASDGRPSGAPYFFNGAFHQWLQNEYGMEAYADFWYRIVNGKNLTVSGAFKKAFGVKLKTAWYDFETHYQVPDIPDDPVRAGLAQDFFQPDSSAYSQLNDSGSLYNSLTSAGGRLVWMDLLGGRVFAADAGAGTVTDDNNEAPVFHHVFSQRGLSSVRLSNDGRFLAVNYISINSPTEKARIKIYDFSNKSFYSVNEKGLREGLVIQAGDSTYLLAQKYLSQHYSLALFRLEFNPDSSRITGSTKVSEQILQAETNPYAFTALKDGRFAWLKKTGLNYSLCISSVSSVEGNLIEETEEFAFPQGMVVRSLSYSDQGPAENGALYFSYAQKSTMPRLGRFVLSESKLYLTNNDFSGGVFEPVCWNDRLVYIGEFLQQNRILSLKETSLQWESASISRKKSPESAIQISLEADVDSEPQTQSQFQSKLESKPYNPFPYFAHGIFIPVSSYKSEYFGPNAAYSSTLNNFYIGATYLTSNPWSNGSSDLITLTCGWNTVSNSFGIDLILNKGTSTSLFNTQTELKTEFDAKGWKQSGVISTISSGFEVGRLSTILISNTAKAHIGRQDSQLAIPAGDNGFYSSINFWEPSKIGITAPKDDTNYFTVSDVITAQFSTIRRAGPGRFEKAGFAVLAGYGRRYDASLDTPSKPIINTSALTAALRICIPRILPIESNYGFTYNLPLRLNFKLLPSSSIRGYAYIPDPKLSLGYAVFDATCEVTAFSMEIQKAIPGITAFYLNDFYVDLGYAATGTAGSASRNGFQTAFLGDYFKAIGDGRGYFLDSLYLRAGLEFTPNIGLLANSNYKMGFYLLYSFTFNSQRPLAFHERQKLSLGLDMSF